MISFLVNVNQTVSVSVDDIESNFSVDSEEWLDDVGEWIADHPEKILEKIQDELVFDRYDVIEISHVKE